MSKAKVILFRDSGKYYTEEEWRVPEDAIGPQDMERSPDFRRISGSGAVYVKSQQPWGYPHLFPGTEAPAQPAKMPDWEDNIRHAGVSASGYHADPDQMLVDTLKAGLTEVVRAIRDQTPEVPVPDEILNALLPVTGPEIRALARTHPLHADWLEGLAVIREGLDA